MSLSFSQNDALKKLLREYSKGDYIMKEGEYGNTLLVLIEGEIDLISEANKETRKIATLRAGEILGEKTILGEERYRRAFSAVARSAVSCLEFDFSTLMQVLSKVPDFSLKIIRVLLHRLEWMNQVAVILRLKGDFNQMHEYFLRYNQYRRKMGDKAVLLHPDEIQGIVPIARDRLMSALGYLTQKNILRLEGDQYELRDPEAVGPTLNQLESVLRNQK